MRSRVSVLIMFVTVMSNVASLFSEESSVLSKSTETTLSPIHEEIRWLQAESFFSEVTTLSRKPVKLSDSAAAVFVITQGA